MKAIILAAGEGIRLRPYTLDRPKCLVELVGKSLLDHQLAALRAAGITDITTVTGYRANQIEAMNLPFRRNADYASTNMVASLMCARDLLDGSAPILVAYADIVYEPSIVRALCECKAELCLTVDQSWERLWAIRHDDPMEDAETLRINSAGNILELGKKPSSRDQVEAQFMGLIKVGDRMPFTIPRILASERLVLGA